MALWKDEIEKQGLTNGATAEVQSSFSFRVSDKAIKPEDAVAMGLKFPSDSTVWPADMANTRPDRHNEVFSKQVLEVFAKQINEDGVTLNLFHNRDTGVGRVLEKASVVQEADGTFTLKGYFWVKNSTTIPNQQSITVNQAIIDRIYKEVSVEVSGMVRWVENPTGVGGIWEYYIDPERPERTEIVGLAICAKGAQRGVGVVKSYHGGGNRQQPNNVNSNSENMQHFIDADVVGGVAFRMKSIEKDGKVEIEGLDLLKKHTEAIYKELGESKTKAAAAETAQKTAEAEATVYKSALVTEITALQLAAKVATPKSATDLEVLKAADLIAMRGDLLKSMEPKDKQADRTTETGREVENEVKALKF